MLKSTKIVAGLGVVAALSVATLPVASFATETNYTGQVSLTATLEDELEIKIDNVDMTNKTLNPSDPDASGTAVAFQNASGTTNLSAGHSYFTGDSTTVTISTNVPNTYTLVTSGSVLTSGNGDTIARAGYYDSGSGTGGLEVGQVSNVDTNGAEYSGSSMWGLKISGEDKNSNAITLKDSTNTNTAFQGADKYQISDTGVVVDYAQVTGSKISNTYTVDYGIGINENQPSGVYSGTVYYSVTHVKN